MRSGCPKFWMKIWRIWIFWKDRKFYGFMAKSDVDSHFRLSCLCFSGSNLVSNRCRILLPNSWKKIWFFFLILNQKSFGVVTIFSYRLNFFPSIWGVLGKAKVRWSGGSIIRSKFQMTFLEWKKWMFLLKMKIWHFFRFSDRILSEVWTEFLGNSKLKYSPKCRIEVWQMSYLTVKFLCDFIIF